MAAIAHLTMDQGATFSSDVTVKDTGGNVFDLTGWTATAKMATGYASTRTRVALTCTISQPTTGVVTLSMSATDTGNLEAPKRYVYDLEISKADDITRVIEGIITVRPQVTT